MNHLIKQADLSDSIVCDSAGTSSYHLGSPPDSRMRAAAKKRGIELRGRARQFDVSDFAEFDLILAMDRENYADILELDRLGKYQDKVRLMCDFASEHSDWRGSASAASGDRDVPDPYYGGSQGFDRVIDLLLDACQGLLDYVVQEQIESK